jgi:hypothetical protein
VEGRRQGEDALSHSPHGRHAVRHGGALGAVAREGRRDHRVLHHHRDLALMRGFHDRLGFPADAFTIFLGGDACGHSGTFDRTRAPQGIRMPSSEARLPKCMKLSWSQGSAWLPPRSRGISRPAALSESRRPEAGGAVAISIRYAIHQR